MEFGRTLEETGKQLQWGSKFGKDSGEDLGRNWEKGSKTCKELEEPKRDLEK